MEHNSFEGLRQAQAKLRKDTKEASSRLKVQKDHLRPDLVFPSENLDCMVIAG